MIKTLSQLFLNTIKSYPKPDFMLYKKEGKYIPISTGEWGDRVKYLALGLKDLGFQSGDKMILLSENSPEWVTSDFASLCLGGITVPIYNSLVPEQMKYIIDNSDAKFLVCSSPELWEKIEVIRSELVKVDHFITFQKTASDGVLTLKEVFEKGKTLDQKDPGLFEKTALAVTPDDVASIIYTSGTTGLPKGVLLTHDNFMSNITEVLKLVDITEKDTVLSFLPLSHVLERMVTFAYIHQGCSIAYAESLETLGENLLEVRPHIMVNVPRVLEKIYAKVIDNVLASSSLKRKIFFWAVKVGKEYGRKKLNKEPISGGLKFKRKVAHKLVFSKIIAKTGGRVRFFVSGGAALAKDIAEFFYAIGIVVLEGYGLTETSPVISFNTFDNLKFGTVGKILPGVEVKIVEDGEILAKGPNIMKGYYRMDEATAEVMDGDWFFTGDIGHLDDDGFLVITDRKKDIIVTAGGKNVAPQQIENLVKTNPYISNIVVVGDQRRFISALVIPEYEKLEQYAALNKIAFESHADLAVNEQIISFIESEIDRMTPSLASYEKVKKIVLLDREFEIDKGEITPSMKVKRNIVEDKYSKEINKLYAD
ncbi:MAG: long-chain fatty acid--CoA ligase [Candidatus Aminicenantes bacterium]|nr:long-chain fatty acid--CoA ligase [Candidatus Aminicenantes bacterium]